MNTLPTEPSHPSVRVYQRWCDSCPTGVPLLDRLGVAYTEVDLESDQEALHMVLEASGGRWITPVFEIGGRLYVLPSDEELSHALGLGGGGAMEP